MKFNGCQCKWFINMQKSGPTEVTFEESHVHLAGKITRRIFRVTFADSDVLVVVLLVGKVVEEEV